MLPEVHSTRHARSPDVVKVPDQGAHVHVDLHVLQRLAGLDGELLDRIDNAGDHSDVATDAPAVFGPVLSSTM